MLFSSAADQSSRTRADCQQQNGVSGKQRPERWTQARPAKATRGRMHQIIPQTRGGLPGTSSMLTPHGWKKEPLVKAVRMVVFIRLVFVSCGRKKRGRELVFISGDRAGKIRAFPTAHS
jgi:hypothetical protein